MAKSKTSRSRENKKTKEEIEFEIEGMKKNQYEISKKSILSEIKIDIKYKTENQKKFAKLIRENEITICSGYPGTGKTFLAIAEALKLLKDNDSPYKKIFLIKSVT